MSRKLLVALAVLSFAFIGSTFAAVESIKVSGDLDTVAVTRSNFDFGSTSLDDNISALASVAVLRFDADLTEDVSVVVSLINERVWGLQTAANDLDLLESYVTLADMFDTALTLKIGYQPVHLGSDLIVGDFRGTNRTAAVGDAFRGGAGDLQYRKNPEGLMAILDLAPLTLTGGFFKADENNASVDDDINVYVFNAAYDFSDTTLGELYYIYKDTQDKDTVKDDVQNVGARLVTTPMDELTLSVEGCYQIGKETSWTNGNLTGGGRDDGEHRSDMAFEAAATYSFLDLDWSPTVGVDVAYISENWDPMYENQTPARIDNALFDNTNCRAYGATVTAQPREDLGVSLRYVHFDLNQGIEGGSFTNTIATYNMDEKNTNLGDEIDLTFNYDYTEDVKLAMYFDWFLPGRAFAEENQHEAFQALGCLMVDF